MYNFSQIIRERAGFESPLFPFMIFNHHEVPATLQKHYLQMEAALDVLEPHICFINLHSLVLQTEYA